MDFKFMGSKRHFDREKQLFDSAQQLFDWAKKPLSWERKYFIKNHLQDLVVVFRLIIFQVNLLFSFVSLNQFFFVELK